MPSHFRLFILAVVAIGFVLVVWDAARDLWRRLPLFVRRGGRRMRVPARYHLTRFQREIIEARMTADDELEYDRIMRVLGMGPHDFGPQGGKAAPGALVVSPPVVDVAALYDEVERRYHAKEISLEQYRAEISELDRTQGDGQTRLIIDGSGR